MVTLIHGDNTAKSFNRLLEIKQNFIGELISLLAKEQTSTSLAENITSQFLFEKEKLIIIENPSANKKLFDAIEIPKETDVLIYEDKKLTPAEVSSLQKKLPGLRVEEFKTDPIVFKFLESLAPKNQKVMLPLWQAYIKSEEPEVALVMIARQVRLLLGDEDFEKLAPWQKSRLFSQAKKFTEADLIDLHSKLLDADYKNKTGQSPLDLATSLELIILSL